MPVVRRKVFAYITHGNRLLVLRHPHAPEAGIQVPAGTVQDGEPLEAAVLREAAEETGLPGLELVGFVGEQCFAMGGFGRDELQHRFFFHLRCTGHPPDRWQHHEVDPADGGVPPLFELFWVPLPDGVPELIAGHGALLPVLNRLLADTARALCTGG
jgi:8-oxo-dGTP pyrophosphatase MutT (NUDIX family)